MTMKKRRSPSSDDILEPNFVQNTQIRLSDIYDKLSVMDGRLRSFEDCSHKIMDKIAILESSVQILETYAVNATLVGRHNSFGKSTLSSSMSSLLQPLTESDDEGTEALESHPEEEGMVESLSRSRSYSELHKMHHSPSLKKSSSPLKAGGSVKFRDKPSSIPRTLGGGESSRFSWSGGGPSKTVEYIKTGPLEVKKRFTGYKRYWCCLKDDLSLLLFSYPEHLRRPDLSTRHRPKYTMRLKGCYVVLREGHESEEEAHKPGGRFDFIRTDNNSIYNQFAAATYQEAKDWVQTFEEASLALNNANNGLRKKQQRRISAQSLNDLHILKR